MIRNTATLYASVNFSFKPFFNEQVISMIILTTMQATLCNTIIPHPLVGRVGIEPTTT